RPAVVVKAAAIEGAVGAEGAVDELERAVVVGESAATDSAVIAQRAVAQRQRAVVVVQAAARAAGGGAAGPRCAGQVALGDGQVAQRHRGAAGGAVADEED